MTRAGPSIMNRRGLGLLELILAITITSITALAVATVLVSVSRGMTAINQGRSSLQRAHAAHVRLRTYTDPALALLAFDPERGIALWLHDQTENGQVNVSELRVFWFNAQEGTLSVEYVDFPDEWTEEMVETYDTVVTGVEDPFEAMEAQRALGFTATSVLADGVMGLDLTHNELDIKQSDRAQLAMTFRLNEDQGNEVLMVLGMPNHQAPQ